MALAMAKPSIQGPIVSTDDLPGWERLLTGVFGMETALAQNFDRSEVARLCCRVADPADQHGQGWVTEAALAHSPRDRRESALSRLLRS